MNYSFSVDGPELLTPFHIPGNKTIFTTVSADGNREIRISFTSNPKSTVTWFFQEADGSFREIMGEEEFTSSINEVSHVVISVFIENRDIK